MTTKDDRKSDAVTVRDVWLIFAKRQLEDLSESQVRAVMKFMRQISRATKPGAPPKYPAPFATDVLDRVHLEMNRLKAQGAKRAGPKSAIRRIIERHALETRGASEPARRADTITKLTVELFKVYEAARRR